jgi:hypothetical protein
VAAEGADINKAGGCCWGGCPAARPTPTHPPLHHQHESLPAPTSKEQDSIDGHHAALPHKHFAGLHNLRVGQPAALKLAALEVDGGGVQEDAACGRRAGGMVADEGRLQQAARVGARVSHKRGAPWPGTLCRRPAPKLGGEEQLAICLPLRPMGHPILTSLAVKEFELGGVGVCLQGTPLHFCKLRCRVLHSQQLQAWQGKKGKGGVGRWGGVGSGSAN